MTIASIITIICAIGFIVTAFFYDKKHKEMKKEIEDLKKELEELKSSKE